MTVCTEHRYFKRATSRIILSIFVAQAPVLGTYPPPVNYVAILDTVICPTLIPKYLKVSGFELQDRCYNHMDIIFAISVVPILPCWQNIQISTTPRHNCIKWS